MRRGDYSARSGARESSRAEKKNPNEASHGRAFCLNFIFHLVAAHSHDDDDDDDYGGGREAMMIKRNNSKQQQWH